MRKIWGLTVTLVGALVMVGTSFAASPLPCDFISACDPCAPVVAPCGDAKCKTCAPVLGAFREIQACDPCAPIAACNPCEPCGACEPCNPCNPCDPCGVGELCNPCDEVLTCNPCDKISCIPDVEVCSTKPSRLKVYADAAALIGNVDGGFSSFAGLHQGFTMAGGVKAIFGLQYEKKAVEVGYTGLYNNLSTSLEAVAGGEAVLAKFHAGDVNLVRALEKYNNVKVFVGVGYANLSETNRDNTTWVSNDLVGLHVGSKWSYSCRRYGIDTYGKLGVYSNTVTTQAHAGPGNCRGAWVAASGLNFTYKLTKHTKLFAGYDLTMIEGVRRASGVFANRVDLNSDRVLVQGFVFGTKLAF